MNSVIRRYIGFQFFFNVLVWIPVFYEVQKKVGLTDPQIFGIQSLYYVVFCLLEVPTGYLADRFGYRCCMLLGAATLVGANLLPVALPDYHGFLWHFILIALARSLISGAASAYMYEYMKAAGLSDGYKKIEGDARFWSLVGRVVAWSAVGWLMRWDLLVPYWISALNGAVAFALCLSMPSVSPAALTVDSGSNVLRALRIVARSPKLILLMLQGVGIFVLVRILLVNVYQPVLVHKGFDVTAFGWLMALMSVFEAVGSKLAPRLRKVISDLSGVTLMTLLLCVSLVLIAALGQAGALAGFCLFSLGSGVAFPIQRQVMNDAIVDSRLRATVLSMESIVDRAICALAVLPLGGLVQEGKLDGTLLLTAAAVASAALAIQALARRLRGPAEAEMPAPIALIP